MRGYVFDALAIDPNLAAVANRIPVLLSRADHRRSPLGFVIAAWHYRAAHKVCQLAAARANGWQVTLASAFASVR